MTVGAMFRIALFSLLLAVGANLFKDMGWLALDEAILVASAGAVLIMFAIPDRKERRDPKGLIFSLLLVLAIYGIALKFRTWLAGFINKPVATVISIAVMLIVGVLLVMKFRRKPEEPQTSETTFSQP